MNNDSFTQEELQEIHSGIYRNISEYHSLMRKALECDYYSEYDKSKIAKLSENLIQKNTNLMKKIEKMVCNEVQTKE